MAEDMSTWTAQQLDADHDADPQWIAGPYSGPCSKCGGGTRRGHGERRGKHEHEGPGARAWTGSPTPHA